MPWAMPAAMAEARVQPVPWVWRVSMRGFSNTCSAPSAVTRRSCTTGPSRWPPLTNTAPAPSSINAAAARRMSSGPAMVSPVSAQASGTLGVSTAACGTMRAFRVETAPASSSASPPFATITGSTTTGTVGMSDSSTWHTASMTGASCSMPVFTQSAPMSEITERICRWMKSGATGMTPWTPMVFWAVSAVMAVAA